jgi:hypothetical protein
MDSEQNGSKHSPYLMVYNNICQAIKNSPHNSYCGPLTSHLIEMHLLVSGMNHGD